MISQNLTICPSSNFFSNCNHSSPSHHICSCSVSDICSGPSYENFSENKIATIANEIIREDSQILPNKDFEYEDFSVAQFIRFLKHIKIKKLLSRITDNRQLNKIKYLGSFILQWSLSIFFFRCGSLNKLHTCLKKLKPYQQTAIFNYLELEDDEERSLPHRTVVNDFLSIVDPDEIHELLITLFKWAKKNKIFYNHMSSLLPNNRYHICCDGVSVHKYTIPHATDENGENICPYCLPRTRNKGKEGETTYWMHVFVNVAIVFPGGLQLPLFIYPLKASQMQLEASASDKAVKQECELQAAKIIFPIIKQKLGNLPITLLTDSLYANEPLMKLCDDLNWEYMIVRQEGSLKTVKRKCDELSETTLYQKSYTSEHRINLKDGGTIEQTIKWFNNVAVGKESYVNVLRFQEIVKDKNGNVVKYFKTEWLCSMQIGKGNCFVLMRRARMRADHEDLHNTLKNRGFAANHDFCRKCPTAWLVWKMLMFVAFWIFELFSFTTLAQNSKGELSWTSFAEDLFSELTKIGWERLVLSPSLSKERIQFRFNFSP